MTCLEAIWQSAHIPQTVHPNYNVKPFLVGPRSVELENYPPLQDFECNVRTLPFFPPRVPASIPSVSLAWRGFPQTGFGADRIFLCRRALLNIRQSSDYLTRGIASCFFVQSAPPFCIITIMPKRKVQDFILHWAAASASERANSQPFLLDLCNLLGVPHPDPQPSNGYFFEFPIVEQHPDRKSVV